MGRKQLHIAEQYADQIYRGKISACNYIQLAVERYYRDLRDAEQRGLVFNRAYPEHCIKFMSYLRLWEDPWAGHPFIPDPWQQFLIWQMYGWRRGSATGSLRFNMIYLEIARKNGKTTLGAALEIYSAIASGVQGAQVYSAATKRDQAKIPFNSAKNMIKATPGLGKIVKVKGLEIEVPGTNSIMQPLSADYGSLDGLNSYFSLIDELHAHKSDQLVNVIKTSTGSRPSWQILEITTAGSNTEGVCYDHRKHSINVLQGAVEDDRWLAMIYTLDDEDSYKDPEVWIKANPSLGKAKRIDYIEGEVKEAEARASYLNTVLRYDFNIWVGASKTWIKDAVYQDTVQDFTDEEIKDLPAFGGLDIASTRDFTSLCLLFYDEDKDLLYRRSWFWIPEDTLEDRMERQLVNWAVWVKAGWIRCTPGNVQDDRTIARDIIKILADYNFKGLSYDKYKAHAGIIQDLLSEGIKLRMMPQGITYMSEPTKLLERLIYSKKQINDPNPVYRWQLGNVDLYMDANENVKVRKQASIDKVDGIVANINALAEWSSWQEERNKKRSAYNKQSKVIRHLR